MIAVGWLLAALWGAPAPTAPMMVKGFQEAQKPVAHVMVDKTCSERRWAL